MTISNTFTWKVDFRLSFFFGSSGSPLWILPISSSVSCRPSDSSWSSLQKRPSLKNLKSMLQRQVQIRMSNTASLGDGRHVYPTVTFRRDPFSSACKCGLFAGRVRWAPGCPGRKVRPWVGHRASWSAYYTQSWILYKPASYIRIDKRNFNTKTRLVDKFQSTGIWN